MLKIISRLLDKNEYITLPKSGEYTKFVDRHTKYLTIKSPVASPWEQVWDIAIHIDTGKNRSGVRYAKSLVLQLINPAPEPTHKTEKIIDRANFAYLQESAIAFYAFPLSVTPDKGNKWLIYIIKKDIGLTH